MNTKSNYVFIGFFVLLSTTLMTFFVVWLLQPSNEKEEQRYRIEFTESVSGLNVDSPVKYRGVTIGKVKKIRISPTNVEKIEVIVSVDKNTPIKVDTVAKLKPQGITGLSYVELSRGSDTSERLMPTSEDEIPLIRSVPSFFLMVERSFGSASENLSTMLLQLKELLGEENLEDVHRTLHHAANVAMKIDMTLTPEWLESFNVLTRSAGALAKHLDEATPKLGRLLEDGDAFAQQAKTSIASLQQSFAVVAETMRVLNERNKNGDYSVKEYMGPGMKQFEVTMREMQQSLILFNRFLIRYGENPSDLLFENQPPLVGPGEKK